MESDQLQQARSIQTSVKLLAENRAFNTPRIQKRLKELAPINDRIWVLWTDQGVSPYGRGGATLKVLRETLRVKHINPISADGRVILKGEPGVRESFRLPHARASDKVLIESARRIIDNAERFRETFLDEGYEPDFIERARDVVSELERTSNEPAPIIAIRAAATRELTDVIRRGRAILDAINRLVAADVPGESDKTVWKTAYRIPRKLGRPKKEKKEKEKKKVLGKPPSQK